MVRAQLLGREHTDGGKDEDQVSGMAQSHLKSPLGMSVRVFLD